MNFVLPRLQKALRLVDRDGTPALTFLRWFNIDFAGAIERQEAAQAAIDARQDLTDADLASVQADIIAAQAQLAAQVTQIQALLGIAQGAALAANTAQTTADTAGGGATQSGSATNPAVNVPGASWVSGPVVNLTGVVAGNLTITGSGPLQDSDVQVTGTGGAAGEFRVVEIDGATETVLFTGDFDAFQGAGDPVATVTNLDATAVTAYTAALTTTGALGYRIDARCTSGAMTSLKLYIYARRAA